MTGRRTEELGIHQDCGAAHTLGDELGTTGQVASTVGDRLGDELGKLLGAAGRVEAGTTG
jgi:hypothetical protein